MFYNNWLVVDLPLWKIWKSHGMMIFPRWWECSKPPTRLYIALWFLNIAMENHHFQYFNRYIIELNGSQLMIKCSSSTFLELSISTKQLIATPPSPRCRMRWMPHLLQPPSPDGMTGDGGKSWQKMVKWGWLLTPLTNPYYNGSQPIGVSING